MDRKSQVNIEWQKTKEQLVEISRKALLLAKTSERELKKLSHHGSLHFDTTALKLRMERLYYLIGKEYVNSRHHPNSQSNLPKLMKELEAIEGELRQLKEKMAK